MTPNPVQKMFDCDKSKQGLRWTTDHAIYQYSYPQNLWKICRSTCDHNVAVSANLWSHSQNFWPPYSLGIHDKAWLASLKQRREPVSAPFLTLFALLRSFGE